MLQLKNAWEVAQHVGKQTNFVRELFNDKSTEGVQRYENVQELLNSIKEWVESPDNDEGEVVDKTLGAYLQQITLLTDSDQKDEHADTVKLMTIHAAKGLEFNCVFAAGLEEMLFPNAMAINTREELEEERRLFYVVITRARQKLWITYANTRYKFGQLVQNEPSRFIEELPGEHLDKSSAGSALRGGGPATGWATTSAYERMHGGRTTPTTGGKYGTPPGKGVQESKPSYITPNPRPSTKEHTPSADFAASDTADIREGQKVEHMKFGFGKVVKLEGASHNPVATILFDTNGEKKIMLNYAKLRIME
jgi:DNA helicase II / ATP-dependent DNA helicase PcrA